MFEKLASLGESNKIEVSINANLDKIATDLNKIGRVEINAETNLDKVSANLNTIITDLSKINRIEINVNPPSEALAKIRRIEAQNLNLHTQALAKINMTEIRNLNSHAQALSEIRKLEMQNLNSPVAALVDLPINKQTNKQQDQLNLLTSQPSIQNISTPSTVNTDTKQTDIKINNRYDIEGVTDPEEIADLIVRRQAVELAAFAR